MESYKNDVAFTTGITKYQNQSDCAAIVKQVKELSEAPQEHFDILVRTVVALKPRKLNVDVSPDNLFLIHIAGFTSLTSTTRLKKLAQLSCGYRSVLNKQYRFYYPPYTFYLRISQKGIWLGSCSYKNHGR